MSGVLYHEEMGIYLGSCFGLGFWSKLDPVGQPCAVTFPNEKEARKFAASWDSPVEDLKFVPVQPDDGTYASIAACKAAGLPEWRYDG